MLGKNEIDWITFTSSSTVKNFFDVMKSETHSLENVSLASIGPVTSTTLRQFGFTPTVEAEPYTIESIVNAIVACEADTER